MANTNPLKETYSAPVYRSAQTANDNFVSKKELINAFNDADATDPNPDNHEGIITGFDLRRLKNQISDSKPITGLSFKQSKVALDLLEKVMSDQPGSSSKLDFTKFLNVIAVPIIIEL